MSGSTVSLKNSLNQSLDTLFDPASGDAKLKIAVGDVGVAGDSERGAWDGAATHADGAAFAPGDGVDVIAGVEDGGTTVHPILTDADGRLIVATAATGGNLTNAGTLSLAAGATSQTLFASNLARKYLLIQNNDGTIVEDVWINFGAAATALSPSIKLGPGDSFELNGSFVCTQSVTWIAATTGHVVSAKEG